MNGQTMEWIRLKAPAKTTLSLKVFPLIQPQKKHKLRGVFSLYKKLSDIVYIKQSINKNKVTYVGVKIKKCNVTKTLNFFQKRYNIPPYEVKIVKKIPLGSGLGGSATDSATVIKHICKENKIKLTKKILKSIALNLGSDIPFFLSGFQQAEVSSYGGKIKKIKINLKNVEVVLSGIQTSSKEVYKLFDKTKVTNKNNQNYLQDSAFKLYPQLLKTYNKLYKQHKEVILSGSGGSFILLD